MAYTPRIPPVSDLTALSIWLRDELRFIGQAMGEQDSGTLLLTPLAVEPKKPRDGVIAMADGTNWNPGSGAGAYLYRAGAWRFLG